jgi:acetyl-CoA acetyltransferase
MSNEVFIVGVGMTPLGKHLDKSVKQLTAEAVGAALKDANAEVGDIQAAWFANQSRSSTPTTPAPARAPRCYKRSRP